MPYDPGITNSGRADPGRPGGPGPRADPDPPGPAGGLPRRRGDRFDRYQRSHSWVGFPIAVSYKVFEDRAPYLAALATYYAFISLFPLVLLFVSIAGFVLQGDPHLQAQIVNSALGNVPGIGPEIRRNIGGFRGSTAGVVIGVIGLFYGALGAMQASQAAFNQIYGVPRNNQPNPLKSRLRSLGLLVLLGTFILLTTAINVLISTGNGISSQLGVDLKLLGYALSVLIGVATFTVAFQVLTALDLKWSDVITGGVIAGGAWTLLQAFGSRYVVHQVNHGSALYGVFGVVLATLAWIYLVALTIMISAEINVVMHAHLWPRSLLTPFTDDVDLTEADRLVYARMACTQRFKGWERIAVDFDEAARDRARGGPGPEVDRAAGERPGVDRPAGDRPGRDRVEGRPPSAPG